MNTEVTGSTTRPPHEVARNQRRHHEQRPRELGGNHDERETGVDGQGKQQLSQGDGTRHEQRLTDERGHERKKRAGDTLQAGIPFGNVVKPHRRGIRHLLECGRAETPVPNVR